ncbi:MAG: hypothetical protein AAGF19_06040, partial [Pseudomonadota bacterium]
MGDRVWRVMRKSGGRAVLGRLLSLMALAGLVAVVVLGPLAAPAQAAVQLTCVANQAEIAGAAMANETWYDLAISVDQRFEAQGTHPASVDIALRRACVAALENGTSTLAQPAGLDALGRSLCAQMTTDFSRPEKIRVDGIR